MGFAQRIGFTGFAELKMELVDLLKKRLRTADAKEIQKSFTETCWTRRALEIANIEKAVELPSTARRSHRVAEALTTPEYTYTFGMGVSAHLAELAAYTLTQIGIRAICLSPRYSSPREQLVTLKPGDLVLVFSFPPYSKQSPAPDLGRGHLRCPHGGNLRPAHRSRRRARALGLRRQE